MAINDTLTVLYFDRNSDVNRLRENAAALSLASKEQNFFLDLRIVREAGKSISEDSVESLLDETPELYDFVVLNKSAKDRDLAMYAVGIACVGGSLGYEQVVLVHGKANVAEFTDKGIHCIEAHGANEHLTSDDAMVIVAIFKEYLSQKQATTTSPAEEQQAEAQ